MRKVVMARARSGVSIDKEALKIIQRFQPEALIKPTPFDIERFFECALEEFTDVTPDYRDLQPGIEGFTDSDEMESVIDRSLIEDTDPIQKRRCRATIGHEVGHAVLHVHQFRNLKATLKFIHDKNNSELRLYREDSVPTYCNPEWQAWRFAKAILMPAVTVEQSVKIYSSIRDFAKTYEVNQKFAASRLKELNLLSKIKAL